MPTGKQPCRGTNGDGPEIAASLLAWYDRERRQLPWRAPPGTRAEPYRVWLSEVMLQQTTVKAVTPRFADFLRRWPSVEALAAAPLGEVLAAWAGLGYYARARNLHACARAVVERHGGQLPQTVAELRRLPGVGGYTAAAIAAIAFDQPAMPIDGNIERVVARLFAVTDPLPGAKAKIAALAATLTPKRRSGDFAQGLMDLGATICTPKRPACALCPLSQSCRACAKSLAELLPYRGEKTERPVRRGIAYVVTRPDGAVLLRERPPQGLLGGMLEIPGTPWAEGEKRPAAGHTHAPLEASWRAIPGLVEHTFTHFHLKLVVYRAELGSSPVLTKAARPERCRWIRPRDFHAAALPSVMKKILAHALDLRPERRLKLPA